MAGEHADDEQVPQLAVEEEEEAAPQWLHVLMRTRFWERCSRGHANENRAEHCIFCLNCYEVFCPHCTHNEPGHRVLKIRRYVYRSVVLVKDMEELNVDVSRIQAYIVNGQKGVHLRPMRRSPLFKPAAETPPCKTCGCWLRSLPNLFCCLTCQEEVDLAQDEFSGEEAERRYRNIQPRMLQPGEAHEQRQPEANRGAEAELPAQAEVVLPAPAEVEPPAPAEAELPAQAEAELPAAEPDEAAVNVGPSFRMRPRKQANPQRAPFY